MPEHPVLERSKPIHLPLYETLSHQRKTTCNILFVCVFSSVYICSYAHANSDVVGKRSVLFAPRFSKLQSVTERTRQEQWQKSQNRWLRGSSNVQSKPHVIQA
jgi:hypothetical protein